MANGQRGFAAMSPEQQRAIASAGGRAAHRSGHAHEFTPEEAREAGRKGGRASHQQGAAAKRTVKDKTRQPAEGAERQQPGENDGQMINRPDEMAGGMSSAATENRESQRNDGAMRDSGERDLDRDAEMRRANMAEPEAEIIEAQLADRQNDDDSEANR